MVTSTVLSVGVDWLAVTFPYFELPDIVQDVCFSVVDRLTAEGSTPYALQMYGYNGIKCGELFYGSGRQGSFVQIVGGLSDSLWSQLAGQGGKCSRIDLRADVLLGVDTPTLALRHAEEARAFRDAGGKYFDIGYRDGYGKGDTTYTGSFKSDSFSRVYDKWRQSRKEEYRNVWRYEVVYRKYYANSIFTQLQNCSNWRKCCGDTVHSYFTARGITPLYDVVNPDILVPTSRQLPADSTRLQWLQDTVVPMIKGLASRGHYDAVKRIIDLETLSQYVTHSYSRKPAGGHNAISGQQHGHAGSSGRAHDDGEHKPDS